MNTNITNESIIHTAAIAQEDKVFDMDTLIKEVDTLIQDLTNLQEYATGTKSDEIEVLQENVQLDPDLVDAHEQINSLLHKNAELEKDLVDTDKQILDLLGKNASMQIYIEETLKEKVANAYCEGQIDVILKTN